MDHQLSLPITANFENHLPKFAQLLMLDFFRMQHGHWTSATRIFTWKQNRVGDLLQYQISYAR